MDRIYRLEAQSLLFKFGFWDGDIFSDEIEEYYEQCKQQGIVPRHGMHHDVLVAVVRKYLLPSIPLKLEVEEFTTMHNPIRVVGLTGPEDYALYQDLLENEFVEVTALQVQEIINSIHSEFITKK